MIGWPRFRHASIWIALAAFAAVLLGLVRRDAAADRDRAARIEEMERARKLRDRVDRARRRHGERMRPFEDAGWRD